MFASVRGIHSLRDASTVLKQVEANVEHWAQRKKLLKSTSGVRASDEEFLHGFHKACFHILNHKAFEATFAFAIFFNLVLVIIESDATAKGLDSPTWAEITSWVILIMFVGELTLRLYVLRFDFWLDSCNVFDFVLVIVDSVLNVLGLVMGKMFPVSFLRIVRLLKLARASKLFRAFPELRLMIGGLMGSLKVIFWGTVLLVFCIVIFAILGVQFIDPLVQDMTQRGVFEGCERCPRLYSSVLHASLTIAQQIVCGDSWGTGTVDIIEHYPHTSWFFAACFLSIGMAVMNLILGVVVDVASGARTTLQQEMEDEEVMRQTQLHHQFLDLCKEMDTNNSGVLSREELMTGFNENESFREIMKGMEINAEDLEVLWSCFDVDATGEVTYTEFVTSCYKLKSSNEHFMLAYIKYYLTTIKHKICADMAGIQESLATTQEMLEEEKQVEDELIKMEAELTKEMKTLEHDLGAQTVCHSLSSSVCRSQSAQSVCRSQSAQSVVLSARSSSPRPRSRRDSRGTASDLLEPKLNAVSSNGSKTMDDVALVMEEFKELARSLAGDVRQLLGSLRGPSGDLVGLKGACSPSLGYEAASSLLESKVKTWQRMPSQPQESAVHLQTISRGEPLAL